MRSKALLTFIALALGATVLIAGCGNDEGDGGGGGGYGSQGSAGEASSQPNPSSAAIVSVASVPELGKVIADTRGFTLYDFHKDKGTKSSCYGNCAAAWPPLTTNGAPRARDGAESSMLATTKRNDGTTQVTYAGHPLYTYAGDTEPGEAKGNDVDAFGAEWYALQPNGQEPED